MAGARRGEAHRPERAARARAAEPAAEASLRRQEAMCCLCVALALLVGLGPWVVHRVDRHGVLPAAPGGGGRPGGARKPAGARGAPRPPCRTAPGECRNRCAARDARGCLPAYLLIGARKAGTTSLYQWLSRHPAAVGYGLDLGARAGELQFFNRDALFAGDHAVGGRRHLLAAGKTATGAAAAAAPPWPRSRPANGTAAARPCKPRCRVGTEC